MGGGGIAKCVTMCCLGEWGIQNDEKLWYVINVRPRTDDLNILKDYYGTCELMPNPTTTEVVCYRLSNRLANQKLKVYVDNVLNLKL